MPCCVDTFSGLHCGQSSHCKCNPFSCSPALWGRISTSTCFPCCSLLGRALANMSKVKSWPSLSSLGPAQTWAATCRYPNIPSCRKASLWQRWTEHASQLMTCPGMIIGGAPFIHIVSMWIENYWALEHGSLVSLQSLECNPEPPVRFPL